MALSTLRCLDLVPRRCLPTYRSNLSSPCNRIVLVLELQVASSFPTTSPGLTCSRGFAGLARGCVSSGGLRKKCLSFEKAIERHQLHNELGQRVAGQPAARSTRAVAMASVPVAGPGTVELAGALFTFATAFVVPMYTLMMVAPKWEWTKKAVESSLPFVVLGALYIYLFALSCTPETLPLMFSSKYWLPELPGITRMFSNSVTVASAWVHLLAVDLFAARQVFLDGLTSDVETRHSLVLCLMMCPIGIFCHIVTKSVTLFWRRANQEREEPISL